VRLSHALIQPIAAEDVATTVARTSVGAPLNGTLEIAGPTQLGLDDLVRNALALRGDPREVVADPNAPYFGAILEERTLVPGDDATTFDTTFEQWLAAQATPAS